MSTLPVITWTGFTYPWLFLFGLLPLTVLALHVVAQARRRRRVARFVGVAAPIPTAPSAPLRWRHVPPALALIALASSTVALAGPTRDVRIPRNRAVIMLVVDVSQSMRATDVDPTRLAAAQRAAKQFANMDLLQRVAPPASRRRSSRHHAVFDHAVFNYATVNETVCHPVAPSGMTSARSAVWTVPVESVARTAIS